MISIDPRDAVLQAHAPAVMVPRYGALAQLGRNGHRYLVARDGLWLEVKRPWLHLIWPIANSAAPLPYGPLAEVMEFAWIWEDVWQMMEQFAFEATRALPDEHAAWFVWDENDAELKYFPLVGTASPARIELVRAKLAPHEHLAIDIHSHGLTAAGFSATDDADDAGEVKLSVVIGNLDCDLSNETQAMRLCAQGLFIPFSYGG